MEERTAPVLERVLPAPGTSFLVKHYDQPRLRANKLPKWHYHPELELVYVRGGRGRRYVGSHVSAYEDGDLILVGSNLPHLGFTDRMTGNEKETVVQFAPSFPNYEFLELPEMRAVRELLHRSRNGISFHGRTRHVQGSRLERLIGLPPLGRLLLLVDILNELALSEECEVLNADGFHLEVETHGFDRFSEIQQYIDENFRDGVSLEEVSSTAAMTESAFCRYFKKTTGKTFVNYVNQYRVVFATKRLADGHATLAEVAFDSGFNSISQFNRTFKKYTGKTPSAYRAELRKVV